MNEEKIIHRESVAWNPNCVRILFNNHAPLVILVSDWLEFELKLNEVIDAQMVLLLEERSRVVQAIDIALRYLKNRAKSMAQIKVYLQRKNILHETIESVIQYLCQQGIVDDFQYAQMFIEQNLHRMSRQMLRNRLQERGISQNITNDALEKVYSPLTELDVLQSEVTKYIRRKGKPTNETEQMKMAMFLQRKGYSREVIYQCLFLDKVWDETIQ